MAHTFDNISFEDPSTGVLTAAIDGELFTPEGWTLSTVTSSAEETADFGASAGAFIERVDRFEVHWAGLSSYVFAYEVPDNPAEILVAVFNTGISATAFDGFEREWFSNEDYLFGLGSTGIASFAQDQGASTFANYESFEGGWSTNEDYAFDISGISTTAAAFDPVTGTEDFEDFEEEWNDNHNYAPDFASVAKLSALFDGSAAEGVEDFEETGLTQWLIHIATATAAGIYTATIDGEEHVHVAGGAPTVTTIRDGLVAAIAAGSQQISTTTPAADDLTVARDTTSLVPARNTRVALAVSGPVTGDVTKLPTDTTTLWTQTGQMAIDP